MVKKIVAPVDGRANPAQNDHAKFKTFAAETGRKVNKKLAQNTTHTPITHQSGKGTRGVRESYNGLSKTALIRWCAANGCDRTGTAALLVAIGCVMTVSVFAKNWSRGEAGDGVPTLDKQTATELKRLAK